MISNGSGIGVWRGWPGSRLGETARCTLLSGVTSSVTFAPRSEIPRPALANSRAVPDHSRAVCRNRTCKIRCSVTAELQLVERQAFLGQRAQKSVGLGADTGPLEDLRASRPRARHLEKRVLLAVKFSGLTLLGWKLRFHLTTNPPSHQARSEHVDTNQHRSLRQQLICVDCVNSCCPLR